MSVADVILPRINDAVLVAAESLRHDLLARARGSVVELGFGSGLNAKHYGPGVERVLAIEPSDPMWKRGRARAERAGIRVDRIDAFGESIPLGDATADAAVSTFVLCSVRSPERVLAELARVVRPGGLLMLLEHVAHPGRLTRAAQRLVTPAWRLCLGGCHPGRDLLAPLRRSPWRALEEQETRLFFLPRLVEHHLVGVYERG